jgi:tetraacyldisaccharide 4'-kinase
LSQSNRRQDHRPAKLAEPLLQPLARIYSAVMQSRNFGYDREWLKSRGVGAPVVSIGNLTAGGTGKTPLTAFLISELRRRGVRVGVISRGYGGTVRGPVRVINDGSTETAMRFGDEPSWFAAHFKDMPVYICGDRVAAGQALLLDEKVDVIFADDAFQHRRLARALDFVVLDATEPEWHYRTLPLGRMRESFGSLGRADAIFITKTNLSSDPENTPLALRKRIEQETAADIYEMESVISGFAPLANGAASTVTKPSSDFSGAGVVVASGIGRPETFTGLIERSGVRILRQFDFPDHHVFSESDRQDIERAAVDQGAEAIFVTEKDAMKLSGWSPRVPCWVSRLEFRQAPHGARDDLGELYETIARLTL